MQTAEISFFSKVLIDTRNEARIDAAAGYGHRVMLQMQPQQGGRVDKDRVGETTTLPFQLLNVDVRGATKI